MRTLKFDVDHQRISKNKDCDFTGLIAGTAGYLEAVFDFSSDWNDCRKAAVFRSMSVDYPVPIINNRCEIPSEALTEYYFTLRIVGEKDEYRMPTNEVRINQRRCR